MVLLRDDRLVKILTALEVSSEDIMSLETADPDVSGVGFVVVSEGFGVGTE
jgi:hypothetical protein